MASGAAKESKSSQTRTRSSCKENRSGTAVSKTEALPNLHDSAEAMDGGCGGSKRWRFALPNPALTAAAEKSIQRYLLDLHGCLDERGPRPVIPLSHGDPSSAPSFRVAPEVVEAVTSALRSGEFNGYPSHATGLAARRAIAEYLSLDLPYNLSPDDILLTSGCTQAIEIVMSVLGQQGLTIFLPKPAYPKHEAHAVFHNMEVRHYDLVPERSWEVDLEAVEALADENTVAIVITNPNNPCGSVYTYEHLAKVSHSLRSFGMLTTDPATFVEGAIPHIMKNTNDEFFSKIVNLLKETAEICYDEIKEMKCIICPNKPEGSFFLMVKLEVSQLTDISDDIDFCRKLAKEESVMLLPGAALGMENWLRITFATEPPKLKQGLERVKHFCQRHQSQNN